MYHKAFFIYFLYSGENYAERRKQLIQESKYLGGDMEHTHLVKGLDYALLEKVNLTTLMSASLIVTVLSTHIAFSFIVWQKFIYFLFYCV